MSEFIVLESATVECLYIIEADSAEEARRIVDEGFEEPIRTDYIEREIFSVEEKNDE